MKVDLPLVTEELASAGEGAARIESLGYDGAFTLDGAHDGFLPLVAAAAATERIDLYTGIAVAFARTPMTVANIANDLQLYSRGRFMLGLGSQVRSHIQNRYDMPWSSPAKRMREFVQAVRAIWSSYQTGDPLDFRGEIYRNRLFGAGQWSPGPNPFGPPPILIAGVGPLMTAVAGEVGDGFIVHPFNTGRSVRELTVPALRSGAERAGRDVAKLEVSVQVILALGSNASEVAEAKAAARQRIAFYGSTPAYRPVLDLHGWGDLHVRLNEMSKRGEWAAMARTVPDDVVEAVVIGGVPDEVVAQIQTRFGGFATRVSLQAPPTAAGAAVLAGLHR